MPKQHDRITAKLRKLGLTWAVQFKKHGDKSIYYVCPDVPYPHMNDIATFDSLYVLEQWLNAHLHAREAKNEYVGQFLPEREKEN